MTIITSSTARNVLTVVAAGLMVPVGFAYLATGLVASGTDLFGAYALFTVLLVATMWLAIRRSWRVLAMPRLSVGLLVLMLWLGAFPWLVRLSRFGLEGEAYVFDESGGVLLIAIGGPFAYLTVANPARP